ncbi:hypothetical protein [Rubritalea tangerina]|uniref:DUF2339 domain-containing protein n=1 Tax=Rubritalea tangerina TaxID=430798 RepID=A0ABW4ZD33_9BACT
MMHQLPTFTVCYALHLILTGLWRSIEAQAFKPNAFWFCLTLGILSLAAAFLLQLRKVKLAKVLSCFSAALALSFYLYSFVTNAPQDSSWRVALIIISSIAILVATTFPSKPNTI